MASALELRPHATRERLRLHEIGVFRERMQALSSIQQDLDSRRSPVAILRSVHATIAVTVRADSVWVLDGRASIPRPLARIGEPFPSSMHPKVRQCLRTGRQLNVPFDDRGVVVLVPLQAAATRWGVLAARIPDKKPVDAEVLRFLTLAASLLGVAASLWENRPTQDREATAPSNWLSLPSLPARIMLIQGEPGTGKQTLAERMHERYVGGSFATLHLQGNANDEVTLVQTLRQPGLRSLYIHDVTKASASLRTTLLRAVESQPTLVLFLATSVLVTPFQLDPLLSRAAQMTARLTPLREQAAEIPSLVKRVLAERGLTIRIASSAAKLLQSHLWPENYDELARFVAQAEQSLRLESSGTLSGRLVRRLLQESQWVDLPALIESIEAQILAEALRHFDGNQAAVARVLAMTPRQVGYKCSKYGLE